MNELPLGEYTNENWKAAAAEEEGKEEEKLFIPGKRCLALEKQQRK